MATARWQGRRDLWAGRLKAWKTSGLNVREFCAKQGLSTVTFYQWRRKLAGDEGRKPGRGARQRARFVPLDVGGARRDLVELALPGGRVLKFAADTAPEAVAALVAALES